MSFEHFSRPSPYHAISRSSVFVSTRITLTNSPSFIVYPSFLATISPLQLYHDCDARFRFRNEKFSSRKILFFFVIRRFAIKFSYLLNSGTFVSSRRRTIFSSNTPFFVQMIECKRNWFERKVESSRNCLILFAASATPVLNAGQFASVMTKRRLLALNLLVARDFFLCFDV